jgi:hemerythrin-like domain-containing protein
METESDRRRFLGAALAGAGAVLASSAVARAESPKAKPADVNATEDLMREHGVPRRILFLYDEGVRRLGAGEAPAQVIGSSARIIQRFVEGYHEKLEEQFVFPKVLQAGKFAELVRVLSAQHQVGRTLTTEILAMATPAALAKADQRQALSARLTRFSRMYAPHAAREDTDLFPAYHDLFTEKEFDALGDQFEEQERKLLGNGGFEGAVKEVADLEKVFGIGDLAQFTPR